MFSALRVVLGITCAACNPTAYSMIGDYFPPNRRATANSIFTSGIYVGNAVSSLSIIIIKYYGWRNDFIIPGYIGLIIGALGLLCLSEPVRGKFAVVKF